MSRPACREIFSLARKKNAAIAALFQGFSDEARRKKIRQAAPRELISGSLDLLPLISPSPHSITVTPSRLITKPNEREIG